MESQRPSTVGRARWRWLVAALATVALVVSGSGLVAFAQGTAAPSLGPTFLPEDTQVYFEARLDLPDGQKEALAELLSAFPGFADTASFDLVLDQAFDSIVSEATNGALSWQEDVQTWFGGEISVGLLDLAEAMGSGEDPGLLAGARVTDRAALDAFIDASIAGDEDFADATVEEYGGASILVSGSGDLALAATDDVLLVANSADLVKTGIDVLAGDEPSLASKESFATAWARVPTAHLGAIYADVASLLPIIEMAMAAGGSGMPALPEGIEPLLPVDLTAYLVAAPDNLTVDMVITPGPDSPVPVVGESELASLFPATTQVYVELRDIGQGIGTTLETIMGMSGDPGASADVEQMFGAPLSELFGFLGDGAVGGSFEPTGIWVGVAAEVTDQEVAQERLTTVLAFVRAATLRAEDGIAVEESEVGGTTVTTIELPLDPSMTGGIPIDPSLSIALTEGTLLVGLGDFVQNALEADPASSLGADPRFDSAVAYVGLPNAGEIYADVAGLLAALEPILGASMEDYATSAKPYLDALDRFVAASNVAEDLLTTKLTLFVR